MTLPMIGHTYLFNFGDQAQYKLHFVSEHALEVTVVADTYFKPGTVNHFEPDITALGHNLYMITWTESDSHNTVTHVDNFADHLAYTNITALSTGDFWRLKGSISLLN